MHVLRLNFALTTTFSLLFGWRPDQENDSWRFCCYVDDDAVAV